VPFSIDAALQGTISNYTPSNLSKVVNAASPSPKAKSKKAQPDSWFFDIHEDTPEQESTNMLFHNASVLDISSDDDAETIRAKDAAVRGKENVPPPEYVSTRGRARDAVTPDAMVEDRRPLGEMDVKSFWKDGEEEIVLIEEKEDKDVVVEEEELRAPHNSPQKEVEVTVVIAKTDVVAQIVDQEFVIFKDEASSALVN
jgi:hypothetical protein